MTATATTRSPRRAEFLADVITTAIEGGIGYWSQCTRYRWWSPTLQGGTAEHEEGEANAYATIIDAEGNGATYELTVGAIASAIGCFRAGPIEGLAEENRLIVVRADRANDGGEIDADAADWIVQVVCFGEVRYG